MITKEEVFKIGKFAKPHGIKGEIALLTECDVFDDSDDPYIVCEMDGILVPFFIEEYRYKSDSVILVKLELVDSEEHARVFTNKDVYYAWDETDEESLPQHIDLSSFIGYELIDEQLGRLGVVTDVETSTINQLFMVDHQGKELLVPAVEQLIKEVDHENRSLTVSLPEGLLNL